MSTFFLLLQAVNATHIREKFSDHASFTISIPKTRPQDTGIYECAVECLESGYVRSSNVAVTVFGNSSLTLYWLLNQMLVFKNIDFSHHSPKEITNRQKICHGDFSWLACLRIKYFPGTAFLVLLQ